MAGFITPIGNLLAPFSQWVFNSNPPSGQANPTQGPYRPPNWSTQPQLTMLTVASSSSSGASGGQQANYFFDATFRTEHEQELRYTQHPVQNGAAISDHVYLMPSRVVLEIGMSDVMADYIPGQYSGGKSKSVTAYQKLRQIQAQGVPLSLSTRLFSYTNLVIANISANDDHSTQFGLKVRVSFAQIIPAKIQTSTFNTLDASIMSQPLSARPQDSLDTPLATKAATDPSQSTQINNNVPEALSSGQLSPQSLSSGSIDQQNLVNGNIEAGSLVPGAGQWSSNPLNSTSVGSLSLGPN